MAILSDRDIRLLCIGDIGSGVEPLITPFSEGVSGGGKISYGLTTAGYDLRLDREILVFKNTYGEIINPKKFNDEAYRKRVFETRVIEEDHFIVPAHSYILGRSHERICVPRHIKGRCVGKSTLARAGILINTTPLEPSWKGFLTIEIANINPCPAMIFVMEGIAQLEFDTLTSPPEIDYAQKNGKYQNQIGVVPPMVR